MFGKVRIETSEEIVEYLRPVGELRFRSNTDLSGSVWAFSDQVHREQRFFELANTLDGPRQRLKAGTRYMVEDVALLHPPLGRHIAAVAVDAYRHSEAKLFTEFVDESIGLTIDESQFKTLAARGIWEFLSGHRLESDQQAVEALHDSIRQEDEGLLAYLNRF